MDVPEAGPVLSTDTPAVEETAAEASPSKRKLKSLLEKSLVALESVVLSDE